MRAVIEHIPGGEPGLRAKIARIRQLVADAKRDPWFRDQVTRLVQHVPQKDYRGERERIIRWVMRHVRYVRDPYDEGGLELFSTPQRMMRDILRTGRAHEDCDGHVILAAAMLETIGHPTRYRVGAVAPGDYRHIWLEVQDPRTRRWHAYELTDKGPHARGIGDPSGMFPIVETHAQLGDLAGHGVGGWTVYQAQKAINWMRSQGIDVPSWMRRAYPYFVAIPQTWPQVGTNELRALAQRMGLYRPPPPKVCTDQEIGWAHRLLAKALPTGLDPQAAAQKAYHHIGRVPPNQPVPLVGCLQPDPRIDRLMWSTYHAFPLWFSEGNPLQPGFRGVWGPPAAWKRPSSWRRLVRATFADNPIGWFFESLPGVGQIWSGVRFAAEAGTAGEALAKQAARKRQASRLAQEDLSQYQEAGVLSRRAQERLWQILSSWAQGPSDLSTLDVVGYHAGAMKTPTPIEIVPTGGPSTTAVRIASERWYRGALPSDIMRARGLGCPECVGDVDGLGFFPGLDSFFMKLGGAAGQTAKMLTKSAAKPSFWDQLLKFGSGFLDVAERVAPIGMQAWALYQQQRAMKRMGRAYTGPTWSGYLMDWAQQNPGEIESLISQIGGPIAEMVDGAFGPRPQLFRSIERFGRRQLRSVRRRAEDIREYGRGVEWEMRARAPRTTAIVREQLPEPPLLDWTGEFLPDIDGLGDLGDNHLPWPPEIRTKWGVVKMIPPSIYFPDIGHQPTPGWTSGAPRDLREWYPLHFTRQAERNFRNPAMAAYDFSMWQAKHGPTKIDSRKDVEMTNKALRWLEQRIVQARKILERRARQRREAERRRREAERRRRLEQERRRQEEILRRKREEARRKLLEEKRKAQEARLRKELEEKLRRLREQQRRGGRGDDALRREIEELRRRLSQQQSYRGSRDAGGGTIWRFGPPPPPPPPAKKPWGTVAIMAGVAVAAGLLPALLLRKR